MAAPEEKKVMHPDGSYYIGDRDGGGEYYYTDGRKFVGELKSGLPNGRGTLIWKDGSRCNGQFVDGRRHGWVETVFGTTGHKYVGEYKSDQRNGTGLWRWADGKVYEGEFLNHNKHGKGVETDTNGVRWKVAYSWDALQSRVPFK